MSGEAVAPATASTCGSPEHCASPGDVLGTFDCGFYVPGRGSIEVARRRAARWWPEDPWHGRAPRLTFARPEEAPQEVPVEPANPYRLELEDVSAAIRAEG